MLDHFNLILDQIFIPIFLGFLICFLILNLIDKSSKKKISFINIEAKKSPTNAKLLGGLGVSCSLIVSMAYLTITALSPSELKVIKSSIIPIILVTLYGFIDDKYEIRARQKLFFQILAVGILSLSSFNPLKDISTFLYFSISMSVGLALLNGTNLIDGLDTSLIKIGAITSCGFIYLGLHFASDITILISLTTIFSLFAFYFFNKVPAKIYAGEIGGAILGLTFFIQGQIIFLTSQSIYEKMTPLSSLSLICIAAIYPLAELGITFARRLYFKSATFCGDHLHLHHNLKSCFNLSTNQTTTFLLFINITLVFIGFILSNFVSPFIALATSCSLFMTFYIYISYPFWNKKRTQEQNELFFINLKDSPIYILNSDEIEHLYSLYLQKPNESTYEHHEAA